MVPTRRLEGQREENDGAAPASDYCQPGLVSPSFPLDVEDKRKADRTGVKRRHHQLIWMVLSGADYNALFVLSCTNQRYDMWYCTNFGLQRDHNHATPLPVRP